MNISSFMNVTEVIRWSNFAQFMSSSVGQWSGVILATSTAILAKLGIHRWNQSSEVEDENFHKIKEKISQVYGYVFGGFALTTAVAIVSHISGLSQKILQNDYLLIPLFLGSCVTLTATLLINKNHDRVKHAAWGMFNATMGMMLSPLGYLNRVIIAQAAAISLGLGGALTLVAFLAPDRRFLTWEGPLISTLTSLSIASFISLFFPGSAFAYGVDRASLYVGTIVFSGLLMSSTQRLILEAEKQSDQEFDPIHSSMSIYLDGMNLFIRILKMMLESKKEEN